MHQGIRAPESVSDHMYRMAMASFLIKDPAIDKDKVMRIALVHDLAESLAGDIAPFQGVSDEDKHALERVCIFSCLGFHGCFVTVPKRAMEEICGTLNDAAVGNELMGLWLEYEEQSSAEAVFVKDFDKFEMILQADEYEREGEWTERKKKEEGVVADQTDGKREDRGYEIDLQGFFDGTEGVFRTETVGAWDATLRAQREERRGATGRTATTPTEEEETEETEKQG